MTSIAIVSFRLRQTDGVSIVAAVWEDCFTALGYPVTTIAAEGPVDITCDWLHMSGTTLPTVQDVKNLFEPFDIIVIENVLTIPLRRDLAPILFDALSDKRVILHHHDPAWHRGSEKDPFLFDSPTWKHVTITEQTQHEYLLRGIESIVIRNGFSSPNRIFLEQEEKNRIRANYGFSATERIFVHPVRAIERKNIPEALRLCERFDAHYWLGGPAEDGYDETLSELLQNTKARYSRFPAHRVEDLYCVADIILFPSTWEGFGNPPIEASLFRKPVIVGDYPIMYELKSFGFEWFGVKEIEKIRTWLVTPNTELLDINESLAKKHFSIAQVKENLKQLVESMS